MNNPVVTVVLPIYNVESYLERCIKSIIHQTYPNLEIILVDDCSTDRSPRICDEWAEKDDRIRVIHKEVNEGQGIGRNDALTVATGQYICFFDSDDYVMPNTVERLVTVAIREKAEITVCGMRDIDAYGREISRFVLPYGERTYRDSAVVDEFLPDYIAADPNGNGERLYYMSACMALYEMKVLRKLKWSFVSERVIISEDLYSLLSLFSGVSSVSVVPDALYCYCYNERSFSRKYRPDRYREVKNFYLETLKLCEANGYSDKIKYRIAKPYLSYTIATLKQEAKSPNPIRMKKRIMFCIMDDDVLRQVVYVHRHDKVGIKQRILFFVLRKQWKRVAFLLFRLQK